MRRIALILFLATPSFATNLTGWWASDGGQKIARQDFYPTFPGNSSPQCSTCTIGPNWDGTTITQYAAKGETVGTALYLLNGGAADATSVMVTVSSLTCQGGTSIVSVSTPAAKVWDMTGRPTQVYLASYVPIRGSSYFPYGFQTWEERLFPPKFRNPFNIVGNEGVVIWGSNLWTNRPDHDKFYPVGLVPMELFPSSFTVSQSSSQAVWIDTYVSTTIVAGACTGLVTVTEGATTIASIPYVINVHTFALPTMYSFPAMTFFDTFDINGRHQATSYPGQSQEPYRTTRWHYAQLLRAHGFSATIGDLPQNGTDRFPSSEYTPHLDGSLYTAANGYGNARGVGVGDPIYSIGTYSNWKIYVSTYDAVAFCDYVSSWSYNLGSYSNLRVLLYVQDEPGDAATWGDVRKWSTWLSTSCAKPGAYINGLVTGTIPNVASSAPYVTNVVTTGWGGASSTTWNSAASQYITAGTTQTWNYNQGLYGAGGTFVTEGEGYEPRAHFWSIKKKGMQGYFAWQAAEFYDSVSGYSANDVYHSALTFGDKATSYDSIMGVKSYNSANNDGLLVVYGSDTVTTPSYGVDSGFPTWTLKMIRRGVQDMDYFALAQAVVPSTVTATVASLAGVSFWDFPAQDYAGSNSYAYGDRSWSYDPNAYTQAIITLGNYVDGAPAPPPAAVKTILGNFTIPGFNGAIQ